MAKSTAPILLIGGVTIVNRWLYLERAHEATPDFASTFFTTPDFWKPAVATGLTVGAFALLEKANQPLAVGVAWVAFITTLFVPIQLGYGDVGQMNIFERINDVQKNPSRYVG